MHRPDGPGYGASRAVPGLRYVVYPLITSRVRVLWRRARRISQLPSVYLLPMDLVLQQAMPIIRRQRRYKAGSSCQPLPTP